MDDTQKTAMHHASKRARKRRETAMGGGFANDDTQADIVELLIKAKGYLEARDHNGCTALMFAVASGEESIVTTLINSIAHVNVKDFEGHMPLDYALNFGHDNLVLL